MPQCRGGICISAFDGSRIKCKGVEWVKVGVNSECVTVRVVA